MSCTQLPCTNTRNKEFHAFQQGLSRDDEFEGDEIEALLEISDAQFGSSNSPSTNYTTVSALHQQYEVAHTQPNGLALLLQVNEYEKGQNFQISKWT